MLFKSRFHAFLSLAITFAMSVTTQLWSQSRSIYGSGVDEAAVLVRLVDAGAPANTRMRIGPLTMTATGPGSVTPYRPTVADIYTLSYGGKRYEFMPESGGYYSIVATAKTLFVFTDAKHLDPARCQLYFYNASATGDLELKTADGSTKVLGPCAPGSSAQVAVNPVLVSLATFSGIKKLGPDLAPRLERGVSFSVFAYDSSSGTEAFLVKAVVSAE